MQSRYSYLFLKQDDIFIFFSLLVAHGEGKNGTALNEQTKHDIQVHKLDLKMAERQVVGRTLHVNEWNQLPEAQKQAYSQQMLEIVKQRIQSRYSDGHK